MPQRRLRATFMRGGTSNALVFHRADLPSDQAEWGPIFLAAMGSPDPHGRQLDGMGGGVSSLSKICVVGPPSRPGADVDYTFVQISIGTAVVDYSANCGNMSSAIGPFALDEFLVPVPDGLEATVRIHNTNTHKIIISRFPVDGGMAAVDGNLALDGVAGSGAPIRLEFQDPGGARTGKLLPTGHASDMLDIPGLGPVEVSMVDAANPCVFVSAAVIGMSGRELPPDLEKDSILLARLEAIRCQASVAMGLTPSMEAASATLSVPKVAMVAAPTNAPTLSTRLLAASEMDILIRMISIGQPHRAVPLTGALCLAAACRVPGSVPWRLLSDGAHEGALRIGHPSGVVLVDADVETLPSGGISVRHATVYRTARRLFQGEVLYRAPAPARLAAE
jgi:2-methylaconitate cis-trans-isomerase PrpF